MADLKNAMGADAWNHMFGQSDEPAPEQATTQSDEGFPMAALPGPMRAFAAEVARVHQLPADLPGAMALATASAALGQSVFLDIPPHRTPPNLFLLAPAESGTGKSEGFRMTVKPLHDLQADLIRRFAGKDADLRAEAELLEADARSLKGGKAKVDDITRRQRLKEIHLRLAEIELERFPPRLLVEDSTPPKLASMLAARGETLALFSAEAGDVVSNISGRHNATGRTDETLLLKAFSLDAHTQDRVGTGSILLRSPCLAVLLVTTPDEAAALFDCARFKQGGLLPRFLICAPETRWQHDDGSDRRPHAATVARWDRLIGELAESFRLRDGEADTVHADPAAVELVREFRNRNVRRFDELKGQRAFVSRHAEQASRMALVLHCVKHGARAGGVSLARETMEAAFSLLEYFAGQQTKMLAKGIEAAREQRLGDLLAALARYPSGQASAADLKKRNGFDRAELDTLAQAFPERLTILEVGSPKGGRPSTVVSAK